MNMHTQYEYDNVAASEHDEYIQSGWFGFADTADVPEAPGAWTLEDFADILPAAGGWQ
jgi:hypothetical protein